MAWIESHTVLMRHRKLIELARDLGARRSHALGHLTALWHAAMEQQEDGDLSKWSDGFIAECADFPGEASAFVQTLQKHKWLDDRRIHDWIVYSKRYLESKYRTSNPGRLNEIWALHGKSYSKTDESPARAKTKDSPPYQPTIPTNHHDEPKAKGLTKKPTPEEVTAYAKSIDFKLDGGYFCDYQEARGWRLKTGPIKDWKAVVRTWKVNNFVTATKEPEAKKPMKTVGQVIKEQEEKLAKGSAF